MIRRMSDLRRQQELEKARADFASMMGLILMLAIGNTRLGRSIIVIALWISVANYADAYFRITERATRVVEKIRNSWKS